MRAEPCDCVPGEGSIDYYRWQLDRHFIEVVNADTKSAFTVASSYARHVPAMKRNVEPLLHDHPRSDCFSDSNPPASILAAIMNIPSGTLSVPDFEEATLHFNNDAGVISAYGPAQPAKYVVLNLPLTAPRAEIVIRGFGGTTTGAFIRLKQGATARIGNALEADINGPGSYMSGAGHFKLFYNLDYLPADPALPVIDRVPLNACSPTDWP